VLLTEYDEELHINNEKDISYNKGLEQGLEQGIEQGIEKGIEQGRNEQLLESIKNLMTNLGLSAEDAMKSLGIEQTNFDKYLKMM